MHQQRNADKLETLRQRLLNSELIKQPNDKNNTAERNYFKFLIIDL